MKNTTWSSAVLELQQMLSRVAFSTLDGRLLDADAGFDRWQALAHDVRDSRHTLFLVGNGASASMASHMAADLAKNAHIHAQVFSDLSLITAVANDLGYDQVFAEPLRRCARAGDLLLAISSSGASPNILAALELARTQGLRSVTLTAMRPDNPARRLGDLNLYVDAATYGMAETCHAAILHHWMDRMTRPQSARAESGKETR